MPADEPHVRVESKGISSERKVGSGGAARAVENVRDAMTSSPDPQPSQQMPRAE
jgi:hypothetical protein